MPLITEIQLKFITKPVEKKKKGILFYQSHSHVNGRTIAILVSLVSKILMEDIKVMTDKEQLDLLNEMSY